MRSSSIAPPPRRARTSIPLPPLPPANPPPSPQPLRPGHHPPALSVYPFFCSGERSGTLNPLFPGPRACPLATAQIALQKQTSSLRPFRGSIPPHAPNLPLDFLSPICLSTYRPCDRFYRSTEKFPGSFPIMSPSRGQSMLAFSGWIPGQLSRRAFRKEKSSPHFCMFTPFASAVPCAVNSFLTAELPPSLCDTPPFLLSSLVPYPNLILHP